MKRFFVKKKVTREILGVLTFSKEQGKEMGWEKAMKLINAFLKQMDTKITVNENGAFTSNNLDDTHFITVNEDDKQINITIRNITKTWELCEK